MQRKSYFLIQGVKLYLILTCPPSEQIRELVPESQAYMDLLAFERKLDQTIMRKRVDIQEALKRPMKVSKRNQDSGQTRKCCLRIVLQFKEKQTEISL